MIICGILLLRKLFDFIKVFFSVSSASLAWVSNRSILLLWVFFDSSSTKDLTATKSSRICSAFNKKKKKKQINKLMIGFKNSW